ncbi:hypothetical protein BX070DRAFT_219281 [Coemansia spiralis]|nr:hypothetical protein BX070DRAFT_219281 [Coemansia spiralis]
MQDISQFANVCCICCCVCPAFIAAVLFEFLISTFFFYVVFALLQRFLPSTTVFTCAFRFCCIFSACFFIGYFINSFVFPHSVASKKIPLVKTGTFIQN